MSQLRARLRQQRMTDQAAGPLVEAARVLGSAAGKIVAAVTGDPAAPPAPAARAAKNNLWASEYIGSGTFIIHKPKRKPGKRHQQHVKSPRPGMR